MSDSWQMHGAFMALLTKQSSKQFHAIYMADSCIFMALSAKNYFKIVIIVLSCLCLSICRQRIFSSFDIIFIDGFSGSGWSIFCAFFFDQYIGL